MKELRFHGESIISGVNSIEHIAKICGGRVFITTGKTSMFSNGTIDRIKSILESVNIKYEIYSGIKSDPDISDVLAVVDKMSEYKPDTLVSVGGGSVIDVSKVAAILYEYPDINIEQIYKKSLPAKRKGLKLIAIPSTSGTAAEVTKAAVISFKDKNLKIGLKTNAFIPDVAILDASITISMPSHIVAETGLDAITHGVESYINKNIDDFTESIAMGAIVGLFKHLPQSFVNNDIFSREKVHNYQCMAGCAFSNVGLGMSHGISHSVGGVFNIGHGLLNAIILPYVLEYNSRDKIVAERLNYLGWLLGEKDFISALRRLIKELKLPSSFAEVGITEEEFSRNFNTLVVNSLKGSTRVNPVKVSEEEMEVILLKIYEGQRIMYESK